MTMDRAMNIVFSCDENYAPFLATTMASILTNSDEEDNFTFYILDGGLSRLSKARIGALRKYKYFKINYISFDYSIVEVCPVIYHFSKAAYFRFFMADLIPQADRLLYLDVDLIVRTSLAPLYAMELGQNIVAAVPRSKSDRLGMKGQMLFNSGVMLIDAAAWRRWKIANKLVSITSEIVDKIELADQDSLNFLFKDHYTYIAKEWNIKHQNRPKINTAKILHFSGPKFENLVCMYLFEYLSKTEFDSFGTGSAKEKFYSIIYKKRQLEFVYKSKKNNRSVAFVLTRMLDLTCLQSLIEYFNKRTDVSVGIYIVKDDGQREIDEFVEKKLQDYNLEYRVQPSTINEKIIFLSNPYLNDLDYLRWVNSGNKIIYIPYGTSISQEDYSQNIHYNKLIHNIAWKIYALDEFYVDLYEKYCKNIDQVHVKAIHTSPKFDQLTHRWDNAPRRATTFLWNIHFNAVPGTHVKNLTKTWSAFFSYYKTIYELFRNNNDISLIIRPHHNIYKLNKTEIITSLKEFETLPNVRFEPANMFGYQESLQNVDAFISDLSSMVVDMAITGKPIVLLTYPNSCQWNAFGEKIFSLFTYRVKTIVELRDVIFSLVDGRDALFEQRIAALHDEKLFVLSRSAAEIIAEDIFPDMSFQQGYNDKQILEPIAKLL